jgi:DNA processing protein
MTMTEEHQARIALSYMSEPGDEQLMRYVRAIGAENTLTTIVQQTIAVPSPEHAALIARLLPRFRPGLVDEFERAAQGHGLTCIFPDDDLWPAQLNDLGDAAPLMLYVRGDVTALSFKRSSYVSIVGARAATSYGDHIAGELASDLAKDHIVVSGGAYGIDGTAHRFAMNAGGRTICFLAGGADRAYPAGHANLISQIASPQTRGAVVSEVPPGSTPTKWRFLQRNRLIAAMGHGSVVVEAGWRSGSLNEAGHAFALGRKVGAVPGPITSAASAGTHRLIREYGATLITSADDVRAMLS